MATIPSNHKVSQDVVSLFARVVTEKTLTVIQYALASDPSLEKRSGISKDYLMEVLTCVETTYFWTGSCIYQQKNRPTVGSLSSPILAKIYREYFLETTLGSTSLKPSWWFGYVDNTFILCPHQKDIQISLDYVNAIMEKEKDYSLYFLYVLINRTEQRFRSSVYWKLTFTG